jgi:hypothetical protein
MQRLLLALAVCLTMLAPAAARAVEGECPAGQKAMLTTPTAPQVPQSIAQYLSVQLPARPAIVVAGDSLASHFGEDIARRTADPIANIAGSGDGVQNALWRLDYFDNLLRPMSPGTVLVVLGSNNGYAPPCAVEYALDIYFARLRALWPKAHIVALEIMPRGADFRQNDDGRRQVNAWLADAMPRYEGSYVALDDDALTCGNLARSEPGSRSGDGLACENYLPDNIHLTGAGIAFVMESILPRLQL